MTNLFVGATLGVVILLFARLAQFDRDGSFYPTILIVIASYYVLFAFQSGVQKAVLNEAIVFAGFFAGALAGHRWPKWIIALFLLAHGIYDVVSPHSGAPIWWPEFCLGADVILALAAMLAPTADTP